MVTKRLMQVDAHTGEREEGLALYVPPKHKVFPTGYVALSQEGVKWLLHVAEVSGSELNIICYFIQDLGFKNIIPYTATQFAKLYHFSDSHSYAMFRKLEEKGIIIPLMKIGRSQYFFLNSNVAWKGTPKSWYDNSDGDIVSQELNIPSIKRAIGEFFTDLGV